MQKLLAKDLWSVVRGKARNAQIRRAAIAYVSQDLLGFRRGDVLVVDASTAAIRTAQTNAKLLRALIRKGVAVYSLAGLHAKVILLDDLAVVGSANLSHSSLNRLAEAAIITDHTGAVASATFFIEKLQEIATRISTKQAASLCRIKVAQRRAIFGIQTRLPRMSKLGTRTWLVGVREIDLPEADQQFVERTSHEVRKKTKRPNAEPDWLRWSGSSRFTKVCRAGDNVIQIWQKKNAKYRRVMRATAVLLKKRKDRRTWFFLSPVGGRNKSISWGRFSRLVKLMGFERRIRPRGEYLLDAEIADGIVRNWAEAGR